MGSTEAGSGGRVCLLEVVARQGAILTGRGVQSMDRVPSTYSGLCLSVRLWGALC